jgi:hypothetical protein
MNDGGGGVRGRKVLIARARNIVIVPNASRTLLVACEEGGDNTFHHVPVTG